MDFLSIRKKARERAGAKGESAPEPAPERSAGEPEAGDALKSAVRSEREPPGRAPPGEGAERRRRRAPDSVLTEKDVAEGALQARLQGLAPSDDSRFATWRPGSGPPPVEPDASRYEAPAPVPGAGDPRAPLAKWAEPAGAPAAPRAHAPIPAREPAHPADPLDAFFYRPDEESSFVPTLGGAAPEDPSPPREERLDEFLTFRLGKEEFAVAIEHVREVLRAPAITEVPRAPEHVLGVVTVRGEVVAVVDARARLAVGTDGGAGGQIVIVDAGEGPLGVLVDGVVNVVRLPRGSIEPCPQGISTAASDCVTGIGRWRERLFMVVDAATLLPRDPAGEGR